ncbi:Kinesin light chain 3 [Cladochytrium tenue]|nr:Kinesin light chain 3 [Cladochytrium tenue]
MATANYNSDLDNDRDRWREVRLARYANRTGRPVDAVPAADHASEGQGSHAAHTTSKPSPLDFSTLGVPVWYLWAFVADCGGLPALQGLTTNDVCERFVKPLTAQSRLSLAEQLAASDTSAAAAARAGASGSDDPPHLVGVRSADWFVSHAWSYDFLDVVEAITLFAEDERRTLGPDTVVWFDLFSNSQHGTAERGFVWWTGTFTNAIRTLGNVVMVLSPMDRPVPLTRSWCVFELYTCRKTTSNFEVALSRAQAAALLDALRDDPASIYGVFRNIHCQLSSATNPADQREIFRAIQASGGFAVLDREVFAVLEAWTVSRLRELAAAEPDVVERSYWNSALATTLRLQGTYDEAADIQRACLAVREASLGLDHPATVTSLSNLATIYQAQGRAADAVRLFRDALDRCDRAAQSATVEASPMALMLSCNLAGALRANGSGKEALQLYETCLKKFEATRGRDHPETLSCMDHLAGLYQELERLAEAESLFAACVEGRRRALGEDHPDTLVSLNNLGALLERRGRLDAALPVYIECLEQSRRVLGDDHPDTLVSLNNLGNLYRQTEKDADAERLLTECLRKRRAVLGEDHPATIVSINNLAVFYKDVGRYADATPLAEEAAEKAARVFGPKNPKTEAIGGNLEDLYALSKTDKKKCAVM